MADVLPQIVLVLVLVVLNAAFAGTEMALVSLREGQLQRLEQHSATGAILVGLARKPNEFLATIQIGITLAGFLASAAAAVSIAKPLEQPLAFLGEAAGPVAIIGVTLVLAYLTLVFGELAPKRVALQRAEKWSLVMARPLALMSKLTRPAVWLLSKSTDVAVRMMGADPKLQRDQVTGEELRDMVAVQPTFTHEQRQIIDGAFEIAERVLREVLVPRGEVFVLDADEGCDTALRALADSGHSRAPVSLGCNLDDLVGVVHLRDLLDGGSAPARTVAREVPVLPAGAKVLATLRELQSKRIQMAFVANEYGGIEGLITVEDLVEELVGEIWDETDPNVASVRRHADGSMTLPGRFPIHDLRDVGMELPVGDYATIAGLVLHRLGFIPDTPGAVVAVDGWRIEVTGVRRHTIVEVVTRPLTAAEKATAGHADD